MSSMIPMAIGGALSGAQARDSGKSSGLLGGPNAIDGSMQSFINLADPANIFGGSSSGHIISNILDPGNLFGFNQAANPNAGQNGQNGIAGGVPSVLPNLGAQSMIPQMPQGGFMPLGQTNPMGGNGGGIFNQMAANSAGQIFNPSPQFTPQPKGANLPIVNKPMSSLGNFNMAIGNSYGRGFQQR